MKRSLWFESLLYVESCYKSGESLDDQRDRACRMVKSRFVSGTAGDLAQSRLNAIQEYSKHLERLNDTVSS